MITLCAVVKLQESLILNVIWRYKIMKFNVDCDRITAVNRLIIMITSA